MRPTPDFDMCMILAIIACLVMQRTITQARDQFWMLMLAAFCLNFVFNFFMEASTMFSFIACATFVVTVLLASCVYRRHVASMQPSTTLKFAYVVDVGLITGALMWLIIR